MSKQIEKRPLLIGLAALAVGICAKNQPLDLFFLIILLGLVRELRSWMVASIFVILGYGIAPLPLPLLLSPVFVSGSIHIDSEGEDRLDTVQSVGSVGGLRILVSSPVGSHLHRGDDIPFRGKIVPVSESTQALDEEQGIQGTVRIGPFLSNPPVWYRWSDWLKDDFKSFIEIYAPPASVGWIQSLWLRSGGLQKVEKQNLASSGAYSVVAASGLHVFVLWFFCFLVFSRLLRMDRRYQIAFTGLVLAAYWLVSGLHESTFRAVVTCLAILSSYLFRREPDLVSVTSLCGIVYLLIYPRLLFTLGFQLSTAVPIVLVFYLPIIRESLRDRRGSSLKLRLKQGVWVTGFVFLTSEPLIAFHTGSIGFGMPISSLAIAFVAPPILGLCLFAYGLKFLATGAASMLMRFAVVPITTGFQESLSWVGRHVLTLTVPAFSGFWVLVYFFLWGVMWREREVAA